VADESKATKISKLVKKLIPLIGIEINVRFGEGR
jgi:hypothetical protein